MSLPKNTTLTLNLVELVNSQSNTTSTGGFFGTGILGSSVTNYKYTVGDNSGDTGTGTNNLYTGISVSFGSNNTFSYTDVNGVNQNITYSVIDSSSKDSGIVLLKDANSNNWFVLSVTIDNIQNGDTITHNSSGSQSATDSTSWTYNSVDGSGPSLTLKPSSGSSVALCFLSGALIQTPNALKCVEELQVGDEITVFINEKPTTDIVSWVGSAEYAVQSHLPDDEAGYPVRILKDSIASWVPFEDLLVTAEHCLFLDGNFIPVRMLVNGQSIFYDKNYSSYKYYHIETEKHSVIMANGLLTESYLDTGNRSSFHSGNVFFLGYQEKSWANDAFASLITDPDVVEPIFRELEQRATNNNIGSISPKRCLTQDANVSLLTDTGLVLSPIRATDGNFVFLLAGDVQAVRIRSRASRPYDTIGPFWDDRRWFGVAVSHVHIFEWNTKTFVTAHLDLEDLKGWHSLEGGSEARWTTGDALLPLYRNNPEEQSVLSLKIQTGSYLLEEEMDSARIRA